MAGPYRAPTAWEVEANIRRAEHFGLEVARMGGMPIIPHANCRFFNGVEGVPEAFWLAGTLRMLTVSDVLVLLPGWTKSKGTCAEYDHWLALPPSAIGERHDTIFDVELGTERLQRFIAAAYTAHAVACAP
jgi:hypothetical protein